MVGQVVLWLILAVIAVSLLAYLHELITGRSSDETGEVPAVRVRLKSVLWVGVTLLFFCRGIRRLLDVAPGSVLDDLLTAGGLLALTGIVVGGIARLWLYRVDAKARAESETESVDERELESEHSS